MSDYIRPGVELRLRYSLLKIAQIEAHGASAAPYPSENCYLNQNLLVHEVAYQRKKTSSQAHGNSKKHRVGVKKSTSTMSIQHK